MKVILCTNNYYPINKPVFLYYTDKLKQSYCNKYDILYYHDQKCYYPDFHPVWFKLSIIKECFELCDSEDDWIIWMDGDAAPVNFNINIKKYLEKTQKKIIMLKDLNNFNAGVFAIPNIDRAKKFIDYVDSQRSNDKYRDVGWREQQVMIDLFNEEYSDFYKIPPASLGFNHYMGRQEFNTFDFHKSWCLHLPNSSQAIRNNWFYYFYYKNLCDKDIIKIIVSEQMMRENINTLYVTDIINNPRYGYEGIEQLLNLSRLRLINSKFIGFNTNLRSFSSNEQIIFLAENILNEYDVILGETTSVENILNQFIVSDLYNRSNLNEYDVYIDEFEYVFDENEMNILISNNKIHFGGNFIMQKQRYYDYYKFLKEKLDKFEKNHLFQNVIRNKNGLMLAFHERILELYCIKNGLKVFQMI